MRLDMKTRKVLLREAAERYRRARKKAKGRLLDEFVALTGYNRCHAARALRHGVRGGDRPVARLIIVPGRATFLSRTPFCRHEPAGVVSRGAGKRRAFG